MYRHGTTAPRYRILQHQNNHAVFSEAIPYLINNYGPNSQHDEVWIEQHENYLKGSYRNRCHIAGVNGLLRLSIPLRKGKNEQQSIKEVQIAYDQPWTSHHWSSIRSAYGNAPYFDYYAEELQPLYQQKWTFLFDFNWTLLQKINDLIGITSSIQKTESYQKETDDLLLDYRNVIHPKAHLQGQDLHFKPKKYPQVYFCLTD